NVASENYERFRDVIDMNRLRDPSTPIDRQKVVDFVRRIIDQRNDRALEMVRMPELRDQKNEAMVEAYYITGLKIQEHDQMEAAAYFGAAIDKAREIAAERPLSSLGR